MKKTLLICFALGSIASKIYSQIPNYVPADGIVGWWPFNNNANDESGNNLNGTVSGATLNTDRNGIANSAYSFDGIDDYIKIVNSQTLNLNSDFAISVWFEPNAGYGSGTQPNGIDNHIVSKWGVTGVGNASFAVIIDQNGLFKTSSHNGVNSTWIGSNLLSIDIWHHVVISKSNQKLYLYYNGQKIDSINNAVSPQVSNYFLNFGREEYGNYGYFKGKIDDIGIWNRALTSCEVEHLYKASLFSNMFVTQPSNQNVNLNANTLFTCEANGTNNTFQWQSDNGFGFQNLSNSGQYLGVENDTLIVSNATMTNNNQQFRCILNQNYCSDTTTVASLKVKYDLGVKENELEKIKISPNPATEQINIQLNTQAEEINYEIIDAVGNLMKSGMMITNNNLIDIQFLNKGIYFVKVKNHKTTLFIKQ